MTDTFVSLHETTDSHFHTIIEGELTFDAKQITISAPDLLRGITVAAERFVPLRDQDKRFLSRLGIQPMPQIVKQQEKAALLRKYLNRKVPQALVAAG
ncbi:MAG: hypothetical protein EOM26_09725 [Alphaproteobacteria bacterium]|nr:hypothetical protein [Alphaproteobacteria bacterium]